MLTGRCDRVGPLGVAERPSTNVEGRAAVEGAVWLWIWLTTTASSDPLNVWPERTGARTVAFNPYFGVGPTFGSLYVFWGPSQGLDLIGGVTAGLEEGVGVAGPYELYVRAFPFPDAEVALVAHAAYVDADTWYLGPELHAMTRPTDWLGLWLNAGWRGRNVDPGYTWLGVEVTGNVPFVAFEVDFEFLADGSVETLLAPSVGVNLGPEGNTGASVGVVVPIDGSPPGVSGWFWRSFRFRAKRRGPPVDPEGERLYGPVRTVGP